MLDPNSDSSSDSRSRLDSSDLVVCFDKRVRSLSACSSVISSTVAVSLGLKLCFCWPAVVSCGVGASVGLPTLVEDDGCCTAGASVGLPAVSWVQGVLSACVSCCSL